VQLFVQNRVIRGVLGAASGPPLKLPLALRVLRRWRSLTRIPARIVGIGVRPEHVATNT
jgi:hypothetical protein